ncbi:SDR family oxidoreductase [Ciceribacter sp. L1K22]|uniref:SDR family oxidoreductase n=1 Tax=Ciceribacter sp. L1K22 TaxID=2820275 RepID=UPI001ABEACA7|nr:SDR family oxidoreductase [Ciceribacter sp. L1K22]MBO3761103.1 SDR family oxidoreductase [Ciceribacter sp. L1K22]
MNTILITGCSSGFGADIARHFLGHGWKVVATMRTPRADVLPASDRLTILPLDVTDPAGIASAVAAAGPIDALVNNAGIGWLNALEGTPLEIARDLFKTNTLGTIAMTQAVLPQLRERRAGVIVNVSSSVTLEPLPLLSVYTASKAAVNAFTEVLALELEPFGVRTHLVLPGRAPDTSFGANARARLPEGNPFPEAYGDLVQRVFAGWAEDTGPVTTIEAVTGAVWRAVTDPTAPLSIPAGADAETLAKAG